MTWEGLNPPYATIVADPPWHYANASPITGSVHRRAGAAANYSTMGSCAILAMPVADIAQDDAHLYLWTTNPHLFGDRQRQEPGPVEIMEAWGFRYVTMLTWVKKPGTLGMGFYFRGETEHILFGVRGSLPIPPERREPNWLMAAKAGHSVKPPAFLDLVERVSPGPYVELFARAPRLGWDSWGLGFES